MGVGRTQSFMENFPYGIKDERIRNRVAGAMLGGDSSAGGLPGNPWPSLAEFFRLASSVRRRLGEVQAPCLAVHAVQDDIASLRNLDIVRRGVAGSFESLLLDDSYHMVTVDRQRKLLTERSAEFFRKVALSHEQPANSAPLG